MRSSVREAISTSSDIPWLLRALSARSEFRSTTRTDIPPSAPRSEPAQTHRYSRVHCSYPFHCYSACRHAPSSPKSRSPAKEGRDWGCCWHALESHWLVIFLDSRLCRDCFRTFRLFAMPSTCFWVFGRFRQPREPARSRSGRRNCQRGRYNDSMLTDCLQPKEWESTELWGEVKLLTCRKEILIKRYDLLLCPRFHLRLISLNQLCLHTQLQR